MATVSSSCVSGTFCSSGKLLPHEKSRKANADNTVKYLSFIHYKFEVAKIGFTKTGMVYKSEPILYVFGTICIFAA